MKFASPASFAVVRYAGTPVIDDSGSTLIASVPTQFFRSAANKSTPNPGRRPHYLLRQPHDEEGGPSWEGFDSLRLCINNWNFDFEGPLFAIPDEVRGAYLRDLTLSVTCDDLGNYPIRTTSYLYSKESAFIGVIDLRYFGENMRRTHRFNLAAHRLPVSTRMSVRFSVDGGGAPTIPTPPSITSVAVALTISGSFQHDQARTIWDTNKR
ncbi:hypothetical protein [Paraburkholderia nodosa]|uniref:hypothetical protein n=1 Tax=Paraburkholderia nodosa TaxID=392320 RepID=UPI00114CC196|nr:hypothetical protein [Paraburkholderia nodosa]